MIIKLRDNVFIKVDGVIDDLTGVWGKRWIKNEQRFADHCIFYSFYESVTEADLPKALPKLDIDR